MIASVDDNQFAQVFDASIKWESKHEIRVFVIEPEAFINLLRSVLTMSGVQASVSYVNLAAGRTNNTANLRLSSSLSQVRLHRQTRTGQSALDLRGRPTLRDVRHLHGFAQVRRQ